MKDADKVKIEKSFQDILQFQGQGAADLQIQRKYNIHKERKKCLMNTSSIKVRFSGS
jgi:hypothetical protein